jgi:hypothetical protein
VIETHTCITVECDACEDGWEDGPWHFASLADAIKTLVTNRTPEADAEPGEDRRWQIEDGQPVLCDHCRNKAVCAVEGHVWSEWSASPGREMFSSRCCYRCSKFESNIDDLVEQMVSEVES